MTKGIIAKFECPSCGNIVKFGQALQTTKAKSAYKFEAPTKCACKRVGGMKLISFECASVIIEADNKQDNGPIGMENNSEA